VLIGEVRYSAFLILALPSFDVVDESADLAWFRTEVFLRDSAVAEVAFQPVSYD